MSNCGVESTAGCEILATATYSGGGICSFVIGGQIVTIDTDVTKVVAVTVSVVKVLVVVVHEDATVTTAVTATTRGMVNGSQCLSSRCRTFLLSGLLPSLSATPSSSLLSSCPMT